MYKQQSVLDLFGREGVYFGSTMIETPTATPSVKYPSTDIVGKLPKDQLFSWFNEQHMKEAETIYNFLISLPSFDDFWTAADYFKKVLNGGVYLYALSVALKHRADTRDLSLPPMWQINPFSFFHSAKIHRALDQLRARASGATPIPSTDINKATLFTTGTTRDPEHKLAWWREDVGLNEHHFHWHSVRLIYLKINFVRL